MAALGSQSIASSYEQLLHVDADGGGNGTTLVNVKDGDNGTTFALQLASDKIQANGTLTVGVDGTGYDVIFYGDTASGNMTWDTSGDDLILNDARLFVDQDVATVDSIVVDTEATSAHGLTIAGDALTTGSAAVFSTSSTALASTLAGGLVEISSTGDTDTNVNNLLYLSNDHADSTATTCLFMNQDADHESIFIDSEATTSSVVMIQAAQNTTGHILAIDDADQLTTGSAVMIKSNSDDNSTRNLVHVINEHASADNTVGLLIQQDGADASIELTGNGSIKFPGTQGASSDANSLDDYEEGTWTPIVSIDTSAITNSGGSVAASGKYTKVGNLVHLQMTYVFGSSISFPAGTYFRISGMPFTIDQQNYSPMLHGNYEDEGANVYGGLVTNIASSTIYMKKDDGTNWSASVPITWANGDQIGLIGTHLV